MNVVKKNGGESMKKLSIICALVMVFSVSLVQAQQYEVAPTGTKNFITAISVPPSASFQLDIYLTAAGAPQNAGGVWIDASGSVADVAIVSAGRAFADGTEGIVGPWTDGAGANVPNPAGPGTHMLVVANLGGAAPDADGDIVVGTTLLQNTGPADATVNFTVIPEVATWTPLLDSDVGDGVLVITQVCDCQSDIECAPGPDEFCTVPPGQTCSDCVCGGGDPLPCTDADPCSLNGCDEATDSCDPVVCDAAYATNNQQTCCVPGAICDGTLACEADFTLTKESGFYQPPAEPGDIVTVKNRICLKNDHVLVGGIQFDICDTPDCLTCLDCELTERTVMFDCAVLELPNGCCRVIMFCKNPGCAINPGECNIVTVVMQSKEGAPEECGKDCIIEEITGIVASDYDGFELLGNGVAGSVCPVVCGDVCPPGSGTANDCGDGMVDIYDIMCEVDLALTAIAPNDCQLPRADVPTGTPPECLAPNGEINILDIMVLIDMALNRQDCCSFYYQGIIY
jgi:hypothetical protein